MRECAIDVVTIAKLVYVATVAVVVAVEAFAVVAFATGLRVLALLLPPPACTDYNRGA
jgi:hypothetical protein